MKFFISIYFLSIILILGLLLLFIRTNAPDHIQSTEKKVQEACGENSAFSLIDKGVYQCYLKNGKKTFRVIVKD